MKTTDNKNPIGFFDSGVGGLSVFSKFKKLLPGENTIYFGDLLHLPYGNKTQNELVFYATTILDFFKTKSVKAVVIACNTSSAQAYDLIKNNYNFKIYPIIQSTSKVISQMGYKRIGVFATEATVRAKKYSSEIHLYNPDIKVLELARKNWVSIVEGTLSDELSARKNIKNEIAEMLEFNPDKIILGCTHYPYLMDEFVKYAPKNIFIDPAEIFVEFIKHDLNNMLNRSASGGNEEFFVSANPENFKNNGMIFYKLKNPPILSNIFDLSTK